jgi:catechol 2,3-dioxygenase-like lactoylglutathione lyase family enzyme
VEQALVPGLALRNVARYVRDVPANVRLYQALGFSVERELHDMVALRHADGLALILHRWDERPVHVLDTAIGFTLTGDVPQTRRALEAAGWRCLRNPEHGDVGFFFVYGDLDGNPINLVGRPSRAAPPAGSVRLTVDAQGKPVAQPVKP